MNQYSQTDIIKIQNIIKSNKINITDKKDNLYIVQYNKKGHQKGVLIDIDKELILINCFKNFKNIISNYIPKYYSADNFKYTRSYEGVLLYITRLNGFNYYNTSKKINVEKSKWGNSPTFVSMFKSAKGPSHEQLFNLNYETSPFCYIFLIVHPDLIVGSRQNVNSPYLIFIKCIKMFSPELFDNCEMIQKKDYDLNNNIIPSIINKPEIYKDTFLTLEEANDFLIEGYYKNSNYNSGESILVWEKNNIILKINSKDYVKRCDMRGDNPNIKKRFYKKIDDAKINKKTNKKIYISNFSKEYTFYDIYTKNTLKQVWEKNRGIIILPISNDIDEKILLDYNYRKYIVWINYVLCLPLHLQIIALNLLSDYSKDCTMLTDFIYEIEKNNIPEYFNNFKIKTIIEKSRRFTENYIKLNQNVSRDFFIKNNIKKTILLEKGENIYDLKKELILNKWI